MEFQSAVHLKKSFFHAFLLLLIFSLVFGACSMLAESPGPDEGAESVSGEGSEDQGTGEEEGDPVTDPAGGDQSASGEDIPPVALSCPKEPMEITMFIHHTWDFSPNRDTEMMKVNGSTAPLASCSLTVHKGKVSMEDCTIPVTNTGFMQTDDGPCDITSSGYAVISLEEGFCQDGVITLTISEILDPDAGYDGAMNCPNISQPYLPFYPPSLNTHEFPIQIGGMSATESMNPDLSGQFKYDKEWTLVSKDLALPEAED